MIKLPNTIKPEDVAALPSLVSAYTLLNNYKSKKIYQLNGDSAYGTQSVTILLTHSYTHSLTQLLTHLLTHSVKLYY